MKMWTPYAALSVVLLTVVDSQLDTSPFQRQVQTLTNEILGASKFQEYLDTQVTYTSTVESPGQVLDKLTNDLYRKMSQRVSAITRLRDTLQSSFSDFDNTPTYQDCCQCCSGPKDEAAYLKFHSENIDTQSLCYTGEGTKSGTEQRYPTDPVLNAMKQNYENNPILKWQYYGGEDGIMSIYPTNYACDDKYDPRYRPWYSHTAFPSPKDVVIIIDRSGSMNTYHNNRQLIDIAKEAAKTVVDTLNPGDRASVVYFSSDAQTVPRGCHSRELALMTPENKDILKSFIGSKDASGSTYYGRALSAAFNFFDDSPERPLYDPRQRVKVILFLTDGEPTDSDYLDVIASRNARLGNIVTILTFGFGSGLGSEAQSVLTDMANQVNNNNLSGTIQQGQFVYVNNPDNLRYQMARYYDFFAEDANSSDVTVSIPYLDAFGLGLITSICLPVHTSNTFRGVTCIDITLSDLFSDAVYFSRSVESYAFIVDGQTRLLTHPLLPRPSDVYQDPVILRVLDLEVETAMQDIVNKILNGVSGEETFSSRRVLTRGDSEHDGVDTIVLESTYAWRNLGLANLTVCVVLGTSDQLTAESGTSQIQTFPYHRLDLTKPAGQCRYINRLSRTDISTIKFAPFAFSSPDYYLETRETLAVIQQYEDYFTGTNEAPFQDGVKDAVDISVEFDDTILKSDTAWQSAVWRYLGLREGVFRLYPGAKLTDKYDHTVRTWYKRALSQKTTITFSQPYVDAFGAGIVITLSKALFESKDSAHTTSDIIAGVLGMDFTMDLFNSYLSLYITACATDKCFVIDNAGYVIAHPDFEAVKESDIEKVENLHITQKEPEVAYTLMENQVMKKDGCINYEKRQIQTFWRITRDSFSGSGGFEMNIVRGTNVYVLHITGSVDSGKCRCGVNKGTGIPACSGSTCECPCYNREDLDYDECTSSFDFGELQYPPCTPPSPSVNLSSVALEERTTIKQLEYCYPVERVCPLRKQKLNCSATAGCVWCKDCNVRTEKECSGGSNFVVTIVVPVVIIVIIIIAIIACKVCGCRTKKTTTTPSAPAPTAAPATTRAASGSNPQAGYDNPAMSSTLPDIRQQYLYNSQFDNKVPPQPFQPDPGHAYPPQPMGYGPPEPPPAYGDALKHPTFNVT